METTTGHKLNQSRQIEESFGNVISCSHQIASDSTVDDSPTPEGRYHHCRHQYDIGTNVMSRAETDPYRELEIYLARVIEEIDDIIVTLPSESLIKTSKEFPTNQQQPHYHKLTNKQKPPYVHVKSCIDKSHINSTDTSKSLNTLSLLQISRKSKSTTSFASSSALPIKNATVQVTAFYPPSNTTEAPAQYRDLSNEFSIVDCDNIRRNSKINKLAMIPMVQKEITSHLENRLSNYDCDKSKDTILSFKSQQKFDNPPRVVFSSKTQRQCNAKESKYDRSIHLSDQNIRFLKNNSSLPVNLNFSRLKYARLKRCQFIYVEPKKTISLSSNLFNAEKTFEETLTANLVDKFSYQFNHDKSHSCKNKMLYSPLSEKICQLSNGSLNNGAIGILKDNFESDYSYVFVEDNHIIMAGTNLLDGGVLKSISREDNGTQSSAFRKIISKQEALINGDIISNAVLFNVSSLSDQHLLDIFNEQTGDSKFQTSTYSMSTVKNDKKSVSPLILKSDITAERISKSDNDKSKINPFLLKTFSNIQQNNVGEKCDVSRQLKEFFDSNVESQKFKEIEIHDIKMLGADPNTGSQSLPISISSLLSQVRNGSGSCCLNTPPISPVSSDIATQTTPIISRSWRFTWVNDCESHRAQSHLVSHALHDESLTYNVPLKEAINEDNRLSSSSSSSSSPQDHLRSMDEISWDSISLDTTDKASPSESDIGTASLPKSPGGRLVEPLTSSKYNREETWQHINRRSSNLNPCGGNGITDVWIRRESVHTQTVTKNINNNNNDDDDGDDDDYEIINNNNYDNVRGSQEAVDKRSNVIDDISRNLKMTVSSSLSSEMIEDLLRVPFSPSTMSLRQKDEPNMMEFCGKSHSAPLLENNSPKKNTTNQFVHSPRSQSERHLSEIEAQEACKWLRAAGFPQYAQMYEDFQFPIEVSGVAKDHPFLETDSLQSLYRRLHALNRCANMKLDTHHTSHHHSTSYGKTDGGEDSDEETQCALSENWTFEKKTRRWSRVCDIGQENFERLQAIAAQIPTDSYETEDQLEAEETEDMMINNIRTENIPLPDELSPRFRRTGSERLRDGAKALLRRVESLKSRRRKRQNRDGVVISGPRVVDVISMEQKMRDLNCIDVLPIRLAPLSLNDSPPPPPLSPIHRSLSPVLPSTLSSSPYYLTTNTLTSSYNPFGDDLSSYCSDGSQGGGSTSTSTRIRFNKAKRFLRHGHDDQGALSDSECQPSSWRHRYLKDANSNHTKVLDYGNAHLQNVKEMTVKPITKSINTRGNSLNLGKDSQRYRDKFSCSDHIKEDKVSILKREDKLHNSFRYTRDDSLRESKQLVKDVTVYREKSRSKSSELAGSQESSSTIVSRDSDQDEESPRHKGTVVRWHSFQRGSLYPESLNPLCPRAMASMSCGQLLVLRKLSLLKLTACMERYCPTHRTGWNWELPKFIRKIKSPDYKDKTVFGVPLLLSLQRTGQALPKCIQIALRWLRANALDQVGIFRKSGVRSRIQKLKIMTEVQGDNINFDDQQAFDVADLVKQYFRELPEALLTNKLSETFIAIFQHVPVELRPDAVQCVLLLLPDEHREALETLLDFLNHVASNSLYNQMTPSNLAVCLAPSLFHFNQSDSNMTNRSSSVSPRRRKTVGFPDQRELSENKAAHDCLLYLVKMHRELFMISSEMLAQCHFNYMEESIPVALHELGSEMKQDWRGYMYACTTALLKEAREKSRGWVTVNNPADTSVEVAYKKVGDGHPLRLWRVSTEVEAPPNELLHRVLRERHVWDPQLLKCRMVDKLDANAEIFQYAAGNMNPLPARDYCILRTWRTDLPKDACVIVETSVEHPDAPVMLGGTRGIVLASRYLIEKCGSGKSRIMHLSRVDTKGRTPEWYNKSYGHITAMHISKIRNSFKHTTDGPESKV